MIAPPLVKALLSALTLAVAAASAPPAPPDFPVARAEPEFRALMPALTEWGQAHRGDTARFERWILPYGPLDLESRKGEHDECSILRNLYLGMAGRAFDVDPTLIAQSFHCGPECVGRRRADLQSKLPRIEAVVASFIKLTGVHLIAQWGTGDDFRVNDLYRIMGKQRETRPSFVMGFVPSGVWLPVEDADRYSRSLGAAPEAVPDLIREIGELSLSAVVRDPGDVLRVVRVGIADNESGLLFTTGDKPPHQKGDKLKDGREIILIEALKPRVYFYETS